MLAEVETDENDDSSESRLTNVYEKLVFDHLQNVASDLSTEAQIDAACLALNRLPPKYVRNTVDWMFFIDTKESERINRAVDMAVTNAIARVLDNPPLLETS
ncbi:MAG: competence protein ComFB [Gammaproteobacteria bacterium]|jgi:competence protein ComFB